MMLLLAGLRPKGGPYLSPSLAGRWMEVTRACGQRVPEIEELMTTFTSVTPNLIVQDIDRATKFYRDVLGFSIKTTVPDAAPFVFVWLERDGVPVFLNERSTVEKDLPGARARTPGGTATLFFVVSNVDGYHASVSPHATVIMPLKTQFYGMREFAIEDPDGHILTFAQRVSE